MTPAPPAVEADGGDPYAAYADAPPAPPQQAADPYAAYSSEPPPKKVSREIGAPESFGIGAREGVTFGAFPAIHGLISAGQSEEERKAAEKGYASGETPSAASELAALFKGLYRVGKDHLIGSAQEEASKTYRAERERALKEQESAEAQNPKSYISGQLTSALATPLGGAGSAASAAGRIGRGIVGGGIGGALYGTGGAISEGEGPVDVAKSAALGGAAGAGLGGLGGAAVEGIGKVAKRAKNIIEGAIRPEEVAGRAVGGAIRDAREAGQLGLNQGTYTAALSSGMPVHNIDIGGTRTGQMGRALTNLSPEAANILEPAMAERAGSRPERIVDTIHRMFGGSLDSGEDKLRLQAAGKIANSGNYRRMIAAGDRPILPPEHLLGAPAMRAAMKAAVERGQNRASSEGLGAFNPGVKVTPDGQLIFAKGRNGAPTYPNIQFWDYVQRELRDAANVASRKGANEEASALGSLRRQLVDHLDSEVPEFQQARRGAAAFFGAGDAMEAGKKFVQMNADPREARRALAQMSPPERELFARGFADELSQALLRKGDWGTIKRAFTSPLARQKIEAALGPARAKELEVVLRAELAAKKTEDLLLGNSTTARQFAGMMRLAKTGAAVGGHGAIGAVGTFELLKDGDYSPKNIIAGALVLGALRGGAHHIDMKVARHMAEMLASEDPSIVQKGAQAVARSRLFDALRRGTEAGTRVAARDLTPAGVGAGVAAVLEHVMSNEEGEHHRPDDQNILAQPSQQ